MNKQEIIVRLTEIAEACAHGSASMNEAVALQKIVLAIEEEQMIINLTQHEATDEQIRAGVVEPTTKLKAKIVDKLTFDALPTQAEIAAAAASLAWLADESGKAVAMIGGAPFLMSSLEVALTEIGIRPIYAYSRRESVEQAQADGSVRKAAVFKHLGFVPASAWEHRDASATRHCIAVTGLPADCDPANYGR